MQDSRLFLRVASKLMLGFALLWLLYVFTRGLFELPASAFNSNDNNAYEFDLSALQQMPQSSASGYFNVGSRELLVIRLADDYRVYWASDPIYGCRLEYLQGVIKPVCIDIEYDPQGYSQAARQQLKSPDYEISGQLLRVF
ncbi:MAG TPA: hypothetical protein VIQ81_12495 [Gammaproteobacteria bacterium]